MAEGSVKPNHRGHYIVEDGQSGGDTAAPEIKFVTPVAQDVELAKSEIEAHKRLAPSHPARSYKRARINPYKARKTSNYVDHVFPY